MNPTAVRQLYGRTNAEQIDCAEQIGCAMRLTDRRLEMDRRRLEREVKFGGIRRLVPSCRHRISATAGQTDARPRLASGQIWGAGEWETVPATGYLTTNRSVCANPFQSN
jgi:hypothetical protein